MRISDWSSDVCSSDLHFRIAGLYVDTNRDEDETSITLGGEDLEFDGIETQHEDIHQQTYAITSDAAIPLDRKSVASGQSVSVRVDLGGGRIITKKIRHSHKSK